MADTKISDLTSGAPLTASDLLIIARAGSNYKLTANDLLGALIAPGHELDYAQITAGVTVTATTAATSTNIVSGNAVTYDGSTIVIVEFFTYAASVDSDAALTFHLFDGSTDLGRLGSMNGVVSGATTATLVTPLLLRRRFTPSAASHTYHVKAWKTAGTASIFAGAGGTDTAFPTYIRITKV